MDSNEDPRQPLINPLTSGDSSSIKYTEPLSLETMIPITSDLTSPTKKKKSSTRGGNKKPYGRELSLNTDIVMADMRRRLTLRKKLMTRLSRLNDVMAFLAFLGIILMVIANEITFTQINNRDTIASWSLKLIITITTITLVILVLVYNRYNLEIYALNHGANDWRMGLSIKRIILIVVEVIVCAVHPFATSFPGNRSISLDYATAVPTLNDVQTKYYVSMGVVLGLPMFARLYLLPRLILYHSNLMRDTGSQSIGYLNQVSINFKFLTKIYLEQYPIYCLSLFTLLAFLVGSWSERACDYDSNNQHLSILDTMWFFVVTFTTVGYGDITPSTYCGRTIAILIAFIGLLTSALLITVLAQKLALNRWEKYVHNFVIQSELAKEQKVQSANVVKYAIKLWALKQTNKSKSKFQYFQLKRKLFQALTAINGIKKGQRQLVDNCIGLPEIAVLERTTNTNTEVTLKKVSRMGPNKDNIQRQLDDVKRTMNNIQDTLNKLVGTMKKE